MATRDQIAYKEASEKLDALIEFSSNFSTNPTKPRYDKIMLEDPFEKDSLLSKVPAYARAALETLISNFELSLGRVMVGQSLSHKSNQSVIKTNKPLGPRLSTKGNHLKDL